MSQLEPQTRQDFVIDLGVNKRAFHWNEVLYFESVHHKTYLVTRDNRWTYDQPIRDLEKTLPSLDFVKISRNTIINLNFVKRLSNRSPLKVQMSDERSLSVSRSCKKTVISRYRSFVERQHSPVRNFYFRKQAAKDLYDETIWAKRDSPARDCIENLKDLSFADKEKLLYLAQQPQAIWLGLWNPDVYSELRPIMYQSTQAGSIPVIVLYRLNLRDDTYKSKWTLSFVENYLLWIQTIVNAVGTSKAIIIFEPNALCSLSLVQDQEQENLLISLIRQSVHALKQCPKVKVYLDAGHPAWLDPMHIAIYLSRAGIEAADGFALNVSNYLGDDINIGYGEMISRYVGGKPFLIDSGRNGLGTRNPKNWCNPDHVGVGRRPGFRIKHRLIDAFLWIKPPGESDGKSSDYAPPAGAFWPRKAIDLVDHMQSPSTY